MDTRSAILAVLKSPGCTPDNVTMKLLEAIVPPVEKPAYSYTHAIDLSGHVTVEFIPDKGRWFQRNATADRQFGQHVGRLMDMLNTFGVSTRHSQKKSGAQSVEFDDMGIRELLFPVLVSSNKDAAFELALASRRPGFIVSPDMPQTQLKIAGGPSDGIATPGDARATVGTKEDWANGVAGRIRPGGYTPGRRG